MKKYLFFILMCLPLVSQAGGKYVGKVRPYYFNNVLYLEPVSVEKDSVPSCAKRSLLQLQETDQDGAVFKNKFSILLASWMAERDVELRGNGDCSAEGDEYIFVVIPK